MHHDEFPKKLKKLRNQRRITQSEMAEILHVSRSCISNYEKGDRCPDMEIVREIASYFHVSTDYLIGQPADSHTEENKMLDISDLNTEGKLQILNFYRFLRKQML